jgi:enamine deaminase RidA (YjgF/YER057c/UK114 family)
VTFEVFNPPELGEPRGWNNGLVWRGQGDLLFVAGQTARADSGVVETGDFVDQFAIALDRVLSVIRGAGGEASSIGRLTIYVTDLAEYRRSLPRLGEAYRSRMGKHFPAMALLEVGGLVDAGAQLEIEATAIVPRVDPSDP